MNKISRKIISLLIIIILISVMSVSAFALGNDNYADAGLNNTGDTIIFYVVIAVTAFCGLVGVLVFGGDSKKSKH